MPSRLVRDDRALGALVEELAGEPVYALDTEFHRERTYYPRLGLLQLATPSLVALVDPLAVDVRGLAPVLEGSGLAVAHAADQDLEVLERACGTVPARLVDTQVAAGFLGLSQPSLGTLLERVLGVRLAKGDQLADWTRRPLSAQQLDYAAEDVAHLLELWAVLEGELRAQGRLEWVLEECEALRCRRRGPGDPEEAWWRLRHSRQLRGTARGVAQCVAAWREERARRLDVPPRFVLPDLALLAVAQRPPRTRRELEGVRGIDGRHLGDATEELLAAIEKGRSLPPSALRLPPAERPDRLSRPVVGLAAALLGQLSSALRIDAAILGTRADLVDFLGEPPAGRLATGWRHELVGAALRRLAVGDAAVAVDGDGGLVLEERTRTPLVLDGSTVASE